ncbi:MAG TPA: C-type lectin domain-containing protein [Kofleriaceae bacterium]|jgi:hypothetical protein
MRARFVGCAIALGAFAAGCGTKLADPGTTVPDADDTPVDALPDAPIDAPPDAMPTCMGGDAHAYDPTSMTCILYFAGPKDYAASETACEGINGKLLVIKAAATNTVAGGLTTVRAWIGATDEGHEGEFRWLDNAADVVGANGGYSNWRAGEPNNAGLTVNAVATPENCAVLEGNQALKTWDDKSCVFGMDTAGNQQGRYAYLCQTPAMF